MAEIDAGADDLTALRRAKEEARLLISEDKDFGELVLRGRRSTPGLVLVRIDPRARHLKWPRLFAAIARFGQTMVGHYVVIDEVRVRSRPLPQR